MKNIRNTNLLLFLIINFFLVSLLSTLRFDPQLDSLLDIDFNFDIYRSILLIFIIGVLQVLFLYLASFAMFADKDTIKIFPAETNKNEQSENSHKSVRQSLEDNYDLVEITSMVLQLADKLDVTVNTIYLTFTPIPNAFTFSLPGRGAIVNINTNVLDFLTKEEVEAVIVHELAHIKENDSYQKLLANAPSFYVQLSLSYFYLLFVLSILNTIFFEFSLSSLIIRVVILLSFYLVSKFVVYQLQILLSRSERAAEMICDLHAADHLTALVTINMLLHLGQRVEAVNTLITEFNRMEKMQRKVLTLEDQKRLMQLVGKFPLQEIDEEKAQIYAPLLYIMNQLKIMQEIYRVPLSDEEIYDLASKSAQSHIDVNSETKKEVNRLIKDWREYDINKDQIISEEELIQFITNLREEKGKFLFSNEIYVDHLVQEHPDFRQRILNVYRSNYEN